MSDEPASSPSTAFCAESVATFFDTEAPTARINLCAFPARTTRQTAYNGEFGLPMVTGSGCFAAALGRLHDGGCDDFVHDTNADEGRSTHRVSARRFPSRHKGAVLVQ